MDYFLTFMFVLIITILLILGVGVVYQFFGVGSPECFIYGAITVYAIMTGFLAWWYYMARKGL